MNKLSASIPSGTQPAPVSGQPIVSNEEIVIALNSIQSVLDNFVNNVDKFSFKGGQSISNLFNLNRGLMVNKKETVIQWICIGLLRGFKLDKMFKDGEFEKEFKSSAESINLWWKGKDKSTRPKGNEMRLSTLLQVFAPLTVNINSYLFSQARFTEKIFKFDELSALKLEPYVCWVGSYVACMNAKSLDEAIKFHEWYISVRSRPDSDPDVRAYYSVVNLSWIGKQMDSFDDNFWSVAVTEKLAIKASPKVRSEAEKDGFKKALGINFWSQIERTKDKIDKKVLKDAQDRLKA